MKINCLYPLVALSVTSCTIAAAIEPAVPALAARHEDESMDMAMSKELNLNHMSMDMIEMGLHLNEIDPTTTSQNSSSTLVPTPHVAHHMHGVPILQTKLLPEERLYWEAYNTTTFLTASTGNKSALYTHIAAIVATIFGMYPLTMVAKNTGLRLYLPFFACHVALIVVALTSLSIYSKNAPNLYPGNAYSKMSIILLFSTAIQCASALIYVAASTNDYNRLEEEDDSTSFDLENVTGLPQTPDMNAQGSPSSRFGSPSPVFSAGSSVTSSDWGNSDRAELNRLMNEKSCHQPSLSKIAAALSKISSCKTLSPICSRLSLVGAWLGVSNNVVFNLLHWGHFFYFLILFPTGVATVFCLGKEEHVFNLLAHFIKGGVFFALGLLSLARYSGAFSKFGWAWNSRYIYKNSFKTFMISMEMVESLLILFYGCTNIFMEHLASPGGAWTAKDLQHALIAFIYIGAGLCGVITELKLAEWKHEKALEKLKVALANEPNGSHMVDSDSIIKASPGFSPNPFPIFTIFWTGILMSSHAQASELATKVHQQWGNLFVYGTVFRLMTYLLMIFAPVLFKTLTAPTKPITELLTSFCLLCGGFVFMELTDPVMTAFEYRGYTPMFTLNISLGLIALFMAWEMAVLWFKDWLVSRR